MLSPSKVPSHAREPVAVFGGAAVAREVMGVQLHLDELTPEDEDRLAVAVQFIEDWVGSSLSWGRSTARGETEQYDPEMLDFISTYPRLLELPSEVTSAPESKRGPMAGVYVERAADYAVACGDSALADNEHAQVTTVRFFSDISRIFPSRPHLSAYSVLRVTVPSDTAPEELEQRARHLANLLPVRWGAAGLMLSGAERDYWKEWKQASFAYCMRHWGVDVGEYAALTEPFYDWIRTVNWLTFLGPSMVRDLEKAKAVLEESQDVSVDTTPTGIKVLRAGTRPERGDINRLDIPRLYARVDRMVRPRRCDGTDDEGESVTFFEAWSDERTRDWLRRFEKGT